MSQEISFEVEPNWQSQYFGTLTVKNIGAVTVNKYLCVMFKSPANVTNTDFNGSTDPWVEITPDISSQQINSSTFLVTAKLEFSNFYTFNSKERLTFYINGDLNSDPQQKQYVETFILAADQIPTGTVNIQCAAAPDEALAGLQQALTFTEGSFGISITVTPGTTSSFQIPPGTYTVTAAELANQDQTVVATASVSSDTITVLFGQETDLSVTYDQIDKYSAIDLTIGDISPLQKEQFHVTVVSPDGTLADFLSPANATTPLRRLPSAIIDVTVDPITLNNVQYSFNTQSVGGTAALYPVTFSQADAVVDISTEGFVQVLIVTTTDLTLDTKITVRLVGPSPANFIYTQEVDVKAGTTLFAIPVAPVQYTVQALGFIQDSTVYVVDAPTTLLVDGSTNLPVKIVRGPNLNVPGFPNFLSFGGITDLTSGNEADFVKARASSIFKYAGVDGAGDPGQYLSKDSATVNTIILAYKVGQQLGQPVLPVLISYTCDLSGGNYINLQDPDRLAHSFGNLILSLNDANETIKTNPVPAVGYIINPDFLGACQQKGLTSDYPMPVRQPLQDALDHWKVEADIPDTIDDTLRGYVLAVNWLLRTIAQTVAFTVTYGWQVNLWGVGSSQWVYTTDDPTAIAQDTATYSKQLGVYDSDYRPDFLAVDRYEADDFTYRAYGNGYCYGPREWPRFFDFCKALSIDLQIPVLPWQIPSSHTPLISDSVADDFDSQHWGTGGSYILGDSGINSDYHNVNPKILALSFNISYMGNNAEDMFIRGEPFDWTNPAYLDFPLRGIFAVSLGGGITTGIVSSIGNAGPWVLNKLNAYMDNPIPLDNTVSASN